MGSPRLKSVRDMAPARLRASSPRYAPQPGTSSWIFTARNRIPATGEIWVK
jgi:hypothetical protein